METDAVENPMNTRPLSEWGRCSADHVSALRKQVPVTAGSITLLQEVCDVWREPDFP